MMKKGGFEPPIEPPGPNRGTMHASSNLAECRVQMEQAGHTHPDKSPPKSRDFNREKGGARPKINTPETPQKARRGETDQAGDSPKPQGDLKETKSRPQPLFPNRG